MSRPRLVCLGNFTIDDVVLPDGREITNCVGGDAFYAALAARLTVPEVEMAAPVGTDLPGAIADAVAARFSTAALRSRSLPTLRNRVTYAADGSRAWTVFFDDDAFETLSPLPADLPPEFLAAEAFLILAMTLDAQERLVSCLRAETDAVVALDLQEDYIAGNEARLRSLIANTDVFLPSADEVRQLLRTEDWTAAARTFAALGPRIVVIKLGPEGVLVHDRARGKTFAVPAYPDAPVDTTGAGDAFCGGFMASFVATPGDLALAARRGAVAASFAVADYGAAGILRATNEAAAARLATWTAATRHVETPVPSGPEQPAGGRGNAMHETGTRGSDVLLRRCHILEDAHREALLGPADIIIRDGAICEIGVELPSEGCREIDASGLLAMPGLVNAHLHSPAAFLKGALVDAPLEIFMLRETPPTLGGAESPAVCRARALLVAMEMLKRGITAVHDDAFFNPEPDMAAIDAIMGAYRDAGIRATVAIDQPEVAEVEKYPFLADLLPDDLREALSRRPRMTGADLIDLYRAFIARWHGAAGDRLRCAVSCSAPQRITPEYLQALTDLSAEHDLPFNVHVLETRLQRVLGDVTYGKSLVRVLDDLGCLDARKQVIHAVWIDERDIEAIARSGAIVAHNPISNLKLGSGVMPFRALREAGVPICLGTDEAACDDTANLWGAVKVGALLQKIADPEWTRWPTAEEMLACALDGGARSLRRDDIGRIAPGARADIALLDMTSLAFLPLNDIRRQLVFAEDGSSVRHVLVDGEVVVWNGRLTTVDEDAARDEIAAAFAAFAPRLAAIEAHAARLEPHYRRMMEKALAVDVGLSRWVPRFPG